MHELSLFFSDAHDTERPKVEAAFHLLRAQMWAAAAAATELEDELCRVTPCHNDAHWKNHNNVIPDLTQLRLHENHTDTHTWYRAVSSSSAETSKRRISTEHPTKHQQKRTIPATTTAATATTTTASAASTTRPSIA